MNNKLFLVLVLVCVATHLVRFAYEILKHKNILKPTTLSFVVVFTNMALLWTSWFWLCSLAEAPIYLHPAIRYAGIVLVFAGLLMFLTAFLTIKTLETYEGDLITKGIYSRIRHPMYLGFLFWLVGMPLYFEGFYSLILAVPFCMNVLLWKHLEEIELENRFLDYKVYKKRTIF